MLQGTTGFRLQTLKQKLKHGLIINLYKRSNRSRAKVEVRTIYILRSMSCYYSLTSQNEGLLPNPLFLKSAFSGEKYTCQYNKWVTWFKCYNMKKGVRAAPTILFWLKLRVVFISCPVLLYPPQHRHTRSTPQAAEASLRPYCCQKQGLYSHSQLHAPTAAWSCAVGKLQFLMENKPRRKKVSVRSATWSHPPWLHSVGRAGAGEVAGAHTQCCW